MEISNDSVKFIRRNDLALLEKEFLRKTTCFYVTKIEYKKSYAEQKLFVDTSYENNKRTIIYNLSRLINQYNRNIITDQWLSGVRSIDLSMLKNIPWKFNIFKVSKWLENYILNLKWKRKIFHYLHMNFIELMQKISINRRQLLGKMSTRKGSSSAKSELDYSQFVRNMDSSDQYLLLKLFMENNNIDIYSNAAEQSESFILDQSLNEIFSHEKNDSSATCICPKNFTLKLFYSLKRSLIKNIEMEIFKRQLMTCLSKHKDDPNVFFVDDNAMEQFSNIEDIMSEIDFKCYNDILLYIDQNLSYNLFEKHNYKTSWDIIQFLTKKHDTQYLTHRKSLNQLSDFCICKILQESTTSIDYLYIEKITDIQLKSEIILKYIENVDDDEIATTILKEIIFHKDFSELHKTVRNSLKAWLDRIKLYNIISNAIRKKSWKEVWTVAKQKPEELLLFLVEQKMYDLCEKWLNFSPHPFKEKPESWLVCAGIFKDAINIDGINGSTENLKIFNLIETFHPIEVVDFYNDIVENIKNWAFFDYIVIFLSNQKPIQIRYINFQISSKIMQQLFEGDQEKYWHLIAKPFSIIEIFLMNSKMDVLSKIIPSISPLLFTDIICDLCENGKGNIINYTDFDETHHNLPFTRNCLNNLLLIYANRALDIEIIEPRRVIFTMEENLSNSSFTEKGTSEDHGNEFVIPKEPPTQDQWIPDKHIHICMVCKITKFSLIRRRHHCRRCGRVVCHMCSMKKMRIPNMYQAIPVRVCEQCANWEDNNPMELKIGEETVREDEKPVLNYTESKENFEWTLTGIFERDKELRNQFNYTFAPSVVICLTILNYHTSDEDCINFLLGQCSKFELFLRPMSLEDDTHPEIDYALMTRMLHCLALAAKVRGGPHECDEIIEKADIILTVVRNKSESLLPAEKLSTRDSLRKLRENLLAAENWSLAVEISLKCGFPISGIWFSWGIHCLRSGELELAREKISHSMTKLAMESTVQAIIRSILDMDYDKLKEIPKVNRPARLNFSVMEIIDILKVILIKIEEKDSPAHTTMENLQISPKRSLSFKTFFNKIPKRRTNSNALSGLTNSPNSESDSSFSSKEKNEEAIISTKMITFEECRYFYEECLHYMVTYGSHDDIVEFLVKYEQILPALQYILAQEVDFDIFLNRFFLPQRENNHIEDIIKTMTNIGTSITEWKNYIFKLCSYLEMKDQLEDLYNLQVTIGDPIRATMTCLRFYSKDCYYFKDLLRNAPHLNKAKSHLILELGLSRWKEKTKLHNKRPIGPSGSLRMTLDRDTINTHLNIIDQQIDMTKFLAQQETQGRETINFLKLIYKEQTFRIPTLFGEISEIKALILLILLCPINIKVGYGLAFRILKQFNLSPEKVFAEFAAHLVTANRLMDICDLINCTVGQDICFDEIIYCSVENSISIFGIQKNHKIENIINLIQNLDKRMDCFILSGHLKSAYLLAIKNKRLDYLQKIAINAEILNQTHIKTWCEKHLSRFG